MVGWLVGRLVGWFAGRLVGWLVDLLVGWFVGWFVGGLVGRLVVGWSICWSVGRLVGLLIGWLVGLLVGWFGWLVGYIQIEGIDYTDRQADKRNAERDLQTKETHWINTPSTKHTLISTTSQPTP